jgi:rare lipoprotein A
MWKVAVAVAGLCFVVVTGCASSGQRGEPPPPAVGAKPVAPDEPRNAVVKPRPPVVDAKRPQQAQSRPSAPAARKQAGPGGNKGVRRKPDGLASYYADRYHGRLTSNGERFDIRKMTAAHRTLPFGTRVRVTNQANGRSVTVRVNDRGPFVTGRVIDLSPAAARQLDMLKTGLVPVRLEILGTTNEHGRAVAAGS